MVGGLHFLNRRWLLAGHLCNFSVLPDRTSVIPIIYVFYLSKCQSFWVRDCNFLHMYRQSSGPNLRAPCTYSKSLCNRSVKGLRGLQWDSRGVWSQHVGVQKLGPMIPNCKSHLGFAPLSAPLLLPAGLLGTLLTASLSNRGPHLESQTCSQPCPGAALLLQCLDMALGDVPRSCSWIALT